MEEKSSSAARLFWHTGVGAKGLTLGVFIVIVEGFVWVSTF